MQQTLHVALYPEAYTAVISTGLFIHYAVLSFPLHTGSTLVISEIHTGSRKRTGRRVRYYIDDVRQENPGESVQLGFKCYFRAVADASLDSAL